MTYSLASIKVKRVLDEDMGEGLWIFFREGISEPLLILPEFEMKQLADIVDDCPENPDDIRF